MQKVLLCLCVLALSSCMNTIDRLKNVGKAPHMSQLEVPIDESQMQSGTDTPANRAARVRRTNSLWQPGSTTFFRDNRAWKVGDILKIKVVIQDSANLKNATNQARDSGDVTGVDNFFGKTVALAKNVRNIDPAQLISASGKHKYGGSGNISRTEAVNTTIAAVVTQVLPNGNLIIQGHQEVRVNYELREVKIAGIIRPKDIAADNSIQSEQIAEARISYGGRGLVSEMQQPRIGTQIVDIVSPF